MPVSPFYGNVDVVGAYDKQRALNERIGTEGVQQVGILQKILAQQEAQRRQEQYRQAIAGAQTPEEQVAAAAQFAGPGDVLHYRSAQLDRQAVRDQHIKELQMRADQEIARVREQAAQNRITKEEADRREAAMREQMTKLAASLRPAPQPRPLQLTTDAEGNQLIVNADGTTTPLTTQAGAGIRKPVAADKPMTEFQGKSALYGTRAAQSDKVLKALEDKVNLYGLAAGQKSGLLGNALMSSEQQRVDQAQRDFVNAVLRQESGAVISQQEFDNAKRQYFPAPGDTKAALDQKRANRALAIQGFARMSGPKGAADIKAILDNPLLPGVNPTAETPQANTATGKIGGYVEIRKTADGRTLGKKADGTIEEVK